MSKTLFFYDLETTGLNPFSDRVMQFAGIRTDSGFKQIGEPINLLVKLNDDTLPSPEAVMVTGITPQKTIEEGISEADFAKFLMSEVFTSDTTAIGFNNIRFDDQFIRHLFWRNFHDPYEWSWSEGRSSWDLLDAVRMTRALRPDGINWPFDEAGVAVNRLELISKANGLMHEKAHDALSDVEALISVAKLLYQKQPQLYDYLFKIRNKKAVKDLVNLENKKPFVYSSGKYDSNFNKTTVAFPLTSTKNGNIIVYDLRHNPELFIGLSTNDLSKVIFANYEDRQKEDYVAVPVKELRYNRSPAVAPVGVLSQSDGWGKLSLSEDIISKHMKILSQNSDFSEKIRSVYEDREEYPKSLEVESQLYDSFVPDVDKIRIEAVRNADATQLADMHPVFIDDRLSELLLHYKARNYPQSLSADEAVLWEDWRTTRIMSSIDSYADSLKRLSTSEADENKLFLLQELQLWAESIMPVDV